MWTFGSPSLAVGISADGGRVSAVPSSEIHPISNLLSGLRMTGCAAWSTF